MALEQFANNAQTTLTHSVATGDLTIQISSFSVFPAAANYRILVDSELMLVTGGVGTTTWTVTRNIEGTALSAHSNGAKVSHILTTGGITQFIEDVIESNTYASLPANVKPGRLYFPTDGNYVYYDTGAVWSAFGPVMPLTPPVPASFSWVNQGTASIDTTGGGICLSDPATGTNLIAQVLAVPGVAYTCTLGFIFTSTFNNYNSAGLALYDPVSGKLVTFSYANQNSGVPILVRQHWTTVTGGVVTVFSESYFPGNLIFLRLQDDGVNWILSFSRDGVHFSPFDSVARNTFITPTKIGFFSDNEAPAGDICHINVLHWSLTTP